jgi:hypothetical protein
MSIEQAVLLIAALTAFVGAITGLVIQLRLIWDAIRQHQAELQALHAAVISQAQTQQSPPATGARPQQGG